ncbi:hypothetical protein [uncultured Ruminococcus sp.]|uniref:hypothetical protein n=1 Tax=uncultured Ruminococcus sp. TaxID=165186 RepID=UPI0025E19084|nr:hypothetical protein [uncultured Ruminococcus sp.]
MKRLIAAILSLTLVFSVSACGNADNDSTKSEKDTSVTTAATKATTSLSGNTVSTSENSDSDTSSSSDTVMPEDAAPLSYDDFNMNTHHVFDKEYSNVIDAQSQYIAGYYSPDSPEDPNAADSSDSEDDTENKALSPRGITHDSTLDDVLAAYGDSEVTPVDLKNDRVYLYIITDNEGYKDTITDDCTYVDYTLEGYDSKSSLKNKYGIRFYFNADNSIVSVIYYKNIGYAPTVKMPVVDKKANELVTLDYSTAFDPAGMTLRSSATYNIYKGSITFDQDDCYLEYTFGDDGKTVEIHEFIRQDNGEYIDIDSDDNEEDYPYEGYEPSTYYYEMSDDNRKITVYMKTHYDSGDDIFAYKEFEYFPEYRTFGVNYNMNGLYGMYFPVED